MGRVATWCYRPAAPAPFAAPIRGFSARSWTSGRGPRPRRAHGAPGGGPGPPRRTAHIAGSARSSLRGRAGARVRHPPVERRLPTSSTRSQSHTCGTPGDGPDGTRQRDPTWARGGPNWRPGSENTTGPLNRARPTLLIAYGAGDAGREAASAKARRSPVLSGRRSRPGADQLGPTPPDSRASPSTNSAVSAGSRRARIESEQRSEHCAIGNRMGMRIRPRR